MTLPPRGFLLGKFMPPHRGHQFLCEAASHMVEHLTVLVCSTDDEPMDGDKRHAAMKAALPNTDVLHMHRDIPQEPSDHPDFWTIWRDAIYEHHPDPIDRVFASEPYVFQLAKVLDAEPVLIDPDREIFPISGKALRADPVGHFDFLVRGARAHYQKRICLLGPESVGKSSMGRKFAARHNTLCMPEYGRTFDVHYKQAHHDQGENWSAGDLSTLAETHIAMRKALAMEAGPLVFEDTDIVQTAVWAEHLLGKIPKEIDRYLDAQDFADLYLLLSPDVIWRNDGARYAGDDDTRAWFFDRAEYWLKKFDLNYAIVSGDDWDARSRVAMAAIAKRFPAYDRQG